MAGSGVKARSAERAMPSSSGTGAATKGRAARKRRLRGDAGADQGRASPSCRSPYAISSAFERPEGFSFRADADLDTNLDGDDDPRLTASEVHSKRVSSVTRSRRVAQW